VADDLFVVYGVAPDPGRPKAGVAAAVRAALEEVPAGRGAFAVSASFVGERNFTRYDVEDVVGERLGRLTGGRYHSRRNGGVPPDERAEWRVVLDGKTLWIALRPYDVPLHRRAWRQHTVPGSLHPPVAAAMARLADLAPGQDVLDPFCGAGTVLLETHQLEPQARYVGVDRAAAALAAAQANWAAAGPERLCGVGVVWRSGDARWVDGAADRIVTNPPWGVRVGAGDVPAAVRRWREVLRPGGVVVAIVMGEQAALFGRGWRIRGRYEVAVAGRHPVILAVEPSRC
jgi:23S rRNA G2445 N2-methylase RlmL